MDNGPRIFSVIHEFEVAEAVFEVEDCGLIIRSDGLPHSPTSAADVDVLHAVDDFGQHIAEFAIRPDGFFHLEGLVARQ